MTDKAISVLLVEDDADEAELLRRSLNTNFASDFQLVTVGSLAEALAFLSRTKVSLVLLDLNLPDSSGIDTFLTLQENYGSVPVILLTGQEDEQIGLRAVRSGAQDFIVKGAVRPDQTIRSMKFAVERHRLLQATLGRSMLDDLTGLYNRRGFLELGSNQLKLSLRNNKELILVYVDLNGMKTINDTLGHEQGDRMLQDAAELLKISFRETDIVARLGGDEFAALALGTTPEFASIITSRLLRNQLSFNETSKRPYELSLSLGVSGFGPQEPSSLEELITRADQAMYIDKRSHKSWLANKR